ncbi:hypothetical protein SO802_019028 [Lithocarpus litseifolius]|uniref:CCHC-type domain-containing protein n=1 Tax=Lithocarpus litseifolius TaxID=425828 RepID=A0AAW2CMI0_9ROSI
MVKQLPNRRIQRRYQACCPKDEENLPIFDESIWKGILDGVNTQIYTIMKHFVGKPSNITYRIYDQLSNLRCRTLGDYRWYKDVFTTRVMHRSDCNSPFWKEKFINGLSRLFGEKVKETLCNPLGVIDYDSLTYGDIFSTIRSEGMKMCRDFKIQSQTNKSEAKYEYEKSTTKTLGKCFNYGKRGHFRKECRSKAKSLINTLVNDQVSKKEIFKLLELDHTKSESASSSSDHEIHQLNQSSSLKPSRASSSSSSGPDIGLACKDSCCRNKTINVLNKQISVLSKQEELLLDLIEQIEDPVVKAQKLSIFHGTLIREISKPEPRIRESKVDLEKIYNRFSKLKKEVMVNDLQKEIKEIKSEVRTLKQELTILRVDNSLLDQRIKNLEGTSHQGNEEGPSSQNPSDDKDETINPIVDMVHEEQPNQSS